ncbi:MAG: right-handed parallel beta-helix repeat-containing protein [Candidatus Sulfotelmatobacter sp.]
MLALHLRRTHFATLVFVTWFLSLPAFAANVTVDCSGSNHQVFSSIGAALSTLSLTGPNTITVGGTCNENVNVFQFDRLTIQAASGHVATIVNAANPPGITLLISGSHNVTLDNLIIEGGSPSVYITSSSSAVFMQNCSVQNSVADGLDLDMESELDIENSSFTNNEGDGIFVANASQMTMGTYPTQRILITGNGFSGGSGNGAAGLQIDGSQIQLNFGVLTISGNSGPGIAMEGGRLQFYGGAAATPGVIENNNYGIILNDAASATLWSAFNIANNASTGISVNGASSITFYSGIDSQGKNAVTTIAGHSLVGMALSQSSAAQMYGPHVVTKNGSANADPTARGGISLEGSSLTIGSGASVSSNTGPGVRLSVKSDLIMFDMTVSNNTEEGVLEQNLSAGGFSNPLTFSGNGGAPLLCDAFSVAFGDAGTIQGEACKNITKGAAKAPNVRIPPH